jgi:flagellar basal body P-ring formation protein FlgA
MAYAAENMSAFQRSTRQLWAATGCAALAAAAAQTALAFEGVDGAYMLRVDMKPQAQVRQLRVVLGDVATVSSPDLALLRRALALPLGQAPRPGEPLFLERGQVERWLMSRTALRSEQIQWSPTVGTLVSTASQDVDGEALVQAAQGALRQHLASLWTDASRAEPRIETIPVSIPAGLSVPSGAITFQVRPLERMPVSKHMLVWLDIFADNRFVRAVPVRFDVSVFVSAPVATAQAPAGAMLTPAMFVEREVDIARMQDGDRLKTAADIAVLGSSVLPRLSRGVRGGDLITGNHVQPSPTVSRGQWASLTSRHGMVTLESRVEVLQDGLTGQAVPVRQANANGSVMARIVGPGQLEIQP